MSLDLVKIFPRINSYLIVLLGVIHLGFAPFNYKQLTFNALWFVATGFAIIFAGFLNIAMISVGQKSHVVWVLATISNLSMMLLFGVALTLFLAPQGFAGLIIFAFATVFGLTLSRWH